jgi:alpha-L-fucosidase 2
LKLSFLPTHNPPTSLWIASNLDHWHSKPGALQGYSFTGGIAMSSILGDGARAQKLLDGFQRFIQPNTLYREGSAPVMETPLHGATVLQEMAMRSQNGTIHLFPALSPKWEKTVFRDFIAEGGFRLSAAAGQGKARWLSLTAPFGGEVVLESKDIASLKSKATDIEWTPIDADHLKLVCKPGGSIEFTDGSAATVEPVSGQGTHPFGLK